MKKYFYNFINPIVIPKSEMLQPENSATLEEYRSKCVNFSKITAQRNLPSDLTEIDERMLFSIVPLVGADPTDPK
jgi:hypothetical protein